MDKIRLLMFFCVIISVIIVIFKVQWFSGVVEYDILSIICYYFLIILAKKRKEKINIWYPCIISLMWMLIGVFSELLMLYIFFLMAIVILICWYKKLIKLNYIQFNRCDFLVIIIFLCVFIILDFVDRYVISLNMNWALFRMVVLINNFLNILIYTSIVVFVENVLKTTLKE